MRLSTLLLFVILLTSCGSPAVNDDRPPDIQGPVVDRLSTNQVLVRNEEGQMKVQEIIVTVEKESLEKGREYSIWIEGEILDSQPPKGKVGKIEQIHDD